MSTEKKSLDPNVVIVAVIGLLGTIAAALIGVYGNRSSSPTPTATPVVVFTNTAVPTAIPTDTVPPGEPTSTPAPPTDTPAPTLTFTPIPPVAIGSDWADGCISSLWMPYPDSILAVSKGNGCLQEPVNVFSADAGKMSFLYERNGNGSVETFGLFAPLPESGDVTLTVRLKELDNVDLWMGVFAEPNIESNGLLMTIPAGNVKNRVIVQKEADTYTTLQSTANLAQGDGYSFTFSFNALSARATLNPNVCVTKPVSSPTANKWRFLGYRGLNGSYRIEGEFVDLVVEQ